MVELGDQYSRMFCKQCLCSIYVSFRIPSITYWLLFALNCRMHLNKINAYCVSVNKHLLEYFWNKLKRILSILDVVCRLMPTCVWHKWLWLHAIGDCRLVNANWVSLKARLRDLCYRLSRLPRIVAFSHFIKYIHLFERYVK